MLFNKTHKPTSEEDTFFSLATALSRSLHFLFASGFPIHKPQDHFPAIRRAQRTAKRTRRAGKIFPSPPTENTEKKKKKKKTDCNGELLKAEPFVVVFFCSLLLVVVVSSPLFSLLYTRFAPCCCCLPGFRRARLRPFQCSGDARMCPARALCERNKNKQRKLRERQRRNATQAQQGACACVRVCVSSAQMCWKNVCIVIMLLNHSRGKSTHAIMR